MVKAEIPYFSMVEIFVDIEKSGFSGDKCGILSQPFFNSIRKEIGVECHVFTIVRPRTVADWSTIPGRH